MKTKVCAIVVAHNVERSITNTLRQLNRAKIESAIVVCNGCTDKTVKRISEVECTLPLKIEILNVASSLGHDVPRAFGAAYARRLNQNFSHFLFIDGDWNGSFGPMLESFIEDNWMKKFDIMWVPKPRSSINRFDYTAPWQAASHMIPAAVAHADPAVVPFIVSTNVFARISPYWLHHPGKWFAYAIRTGPVELSLGIHTAWDRQLTGHLTQDKLHHEVMRDTLLGDAAEGACILLSKPLSRIWQGKLYIGFQKERRTDLLEHWLGMIHIPTWKNC